MPLKIPVYKGYKADTRIVSHPSEQRTLQVNTKERQNNIVIICRLKYQCTKGKKMTLGLLAISQSEGQH